MQALLSREEIFSAISKVAQGRNVICAVAFWGSGSGALFKDNSEEITIVCDLLSGSTNPKVIESMIDMGITVLKLEKFHAKVYYSDAGCVIGSANASTNGLALENAELNGTMEACVYISDKKELSKIKTWLDDVVIPKASSISNKDIALARSRWIPRKRLTLNDTKSGFVESLKGERLLGVGLYLAIYRKWGSEEGKIAFEESAGKIITDQPQMQIAELDYYENWEGLKPGYDVIDIYYGEEGEFEYGGVCSIKNWEKISFTQDDGTKGVLTLCEKIKGNKYFKMTKKDESWLKEVIKINSKEIFKEDKDGAIIPIEEFIDRYAFSEK